MALRNQGADASTYLISSVLNVGFLESQVPGFAHVHQFTTGDAEFLVDAFRHARRLLVVSALINEAVERERG
jgi:hypothetical protein